MGHSLDNLWHCMGTQIAMAVGEKCLVVMNNYIGTQLPSYHLL